MNSLAPLNGSLPQRFNHRKPSGMLGNAKAGIQPSFAVVGYKGRNWWLKWQGDNVLLRNQQTGQPDQTLEVVIVGVNQAVSKIFYAKSYTEGDNDAPDCASTAGIRPDPGVPHPQNDLCATCKHGAWGSRITEAGKRAKECQDSRRIAVVPLADIENKTFGGPMLLRIPATSLQNLSKFSDFLSLKGVDLPWVATRIGFDYSVAYPKLTFEALGLLDDDQLTLTDEVTRHPLIPELFDAHDTGDAEPEAHNGPGVRVVGGSDHEEPGEAPHPGVPPQPGVPPEQPPVPAQEPEPERAPATPPPATPSPAATGAPRNPFQAAAAATAAADAAPAAAVPRRPRIAAPQKAPPDLDTAINELLDTPAA